jgi:hypothetical protein
MYNMYYVFTEKVYKYVIVIRYLDSITQALRAYFRLDSRDVSVCRILFIYLFNSQCRKGYKNRLLKKLMLKKYIL